MNSTRGSLLALPTELTENVVFHMEDKKDLVALRLTCLDLCNKTQTAFIRLFYHTVETSLSLPSIQRLNYIAQDKKLREHVKELYFAAKGKVKREDIHKINNRSLTLHRTFGIGYEWRKGGEFQWDCSAIQDLCVLLATSFIHCRSFRIGSDGADWALLDYRRTNCITSLDVLAILLRVIAHTGIKVQSFAVQSWILVSEEALASPATHYLPEAWDFGKFEDGWSGLHSLDLEMRESNFEPGDTTVEQSAKNNARIISAATHLKRLRLSFYDEDGQNLLLQEVCSSGFNPGLERLVLKLSDVSADALLAFLSQTSQSLETLVFHEMHLSSGTWDAVLSSLQSRSRFPKLNNITIASLCQTVGTYPSRSRRWVSFQYFRHHRYLPAPFDDERFELLDMQGWNMNGLQGIRYRGENMSTAVDVLLKNIVLMDYDQTRKEEEAEKEKDFIVDEWRW